MQSAWQAFSYTLQFLIATQPWSCAANGSDLSYRLRPNIQLLILAAFHPFFLFFSVLCSYALAAWMRYLMVIIFLVRLRACACVAAIRYRCRRLSSTKVTASGLVLQTKQLIQGHKLTPLWVAISCRALRVLALTNWLMPTLFLLVFSSCFVFFGGVFWSETPEGIKWLLNYGWPFAYANKNHSRRYLL